MLNIDKIRAVTEKAREFASGCDRTNCGCQVPQVAKAINYTEALCDEVERLQKDQAAKYLEIVRQEARIAKLEKEAEWMKKGIKK